MSKEFEYSSHGGDSYDNRKLREANAELVKALRECAHRIDHMVISEAALSITEIADKYRAIADKYEVK